MARIEGHGAPTSSTVGMPNDIYVDLNTNTEWECLWHISVEGGRSESHWAPKLAVATGGETGDGHIKVSEAGYAALVEAGNYNPEAVYDVYTEVN